MERIIHAKFSRVRLKQAWVAAADGASILCAFAVVYLGIEALADWGIDWPWAEGSGFAWPVRLVLLAGLLTGLAWLMVHKILLPMFTGNDDETLALAVERHEPDLGGRLIAAVQLSRPQAAQAGVSMGLVGKLLEETEEMASPRNFSAVVSTEPLFHHGSIALLLVVAGIALFQVFAPDSGVLLRRAFLSTEPVPRKTRVFVVTGDQKIPSGDSITIIAKATGILPAAGEVDIAEKANSYTFMLNADPQNPGQYVRRIDNVINSFSYRVILNDGRSERHRIEVVQRPVAVSLDCVQIYPAYIGYSDVHHLPGDLSLVAGSRLAISVKANKPLQPTNAKQFPFNHIHLSGSSEVDEPLLVDPSDPTRATTMGDGGQRGIALPPGTNGLSIYLVDQDGIQSKDPTVYRVELVPDLPPKVRIASGNIGEELVTRVATVHVRYEATDDYAIGKLAFCYTINGNMPTEIPLPLPGERPLSASGVFDFSITSLSLPAAQSADDKPIIQYWLYAEDRNTLTNPGHRPGRGESDKFTLKVVSEEEKREELMSRFGSITADQLNNVAGDEQNESAKLAQTIVSHVNGATSQPATRP